MACHRDCCFWALILSLTEQSAGVVSEKTDSETSDAIIAPQSFMAYHWVIRFWVLLLSPAEQQMGVGLEETDSELSDDIQPSA